MRIPSGSTTDIKMISAEVYNNQPAAVIMRNVHPHLATQPFDTLRIRIEPGAFKLIPHLYFETTFEDGSPCPPLVVNFGKAKGKGISSPSLYNHSEHSNA